MCSRTRSRSPWKPPVASRSGSGIRRARSRRGASRPPRARARPSASAGRSAARPSADCPSPPRRPRRRAPRSHASPSSRRSITSRCSSSSPPGHRARNVVEVAVPPDDARREEHRPAGRSPFSYTTASRPSSRARAAAQRPAMPAPAMCKRQVSEKRRLVLDVLDANAVRAPEEDRVACSQRRRSARPRCRASSASRLWSSAESTSTARWLSSGRSRLARIALVELDVRAADLDARHAVLRLRRREAVVEIRLGRRPRDRRCTARRDRGRTRRPSAPRRAAPRSPSGSSKRSGAVESS